MKKHYCSICGSEISRKSLLTKKPESNGEELICLSCIKEIDPVSYLFILQSIERSLLEELKSKESNLPKESLCETISSVVVGNPDCSSSKKIPA